jgi:hypothetical protein
MERLRTRALPDPQEELIERYCAEARHLLDQATSEEEALAIRTRVCAQLAQECDSPLIFDATQMYVDRVIQNLWQKQKRGNNT